MEKFYKFRTRQAGPPTLRKDPSIPGHFLHCYSCIGTIVRALALGDQEAVFMALK